MSEPSEQEKLEAKYHWEAFRMAMLSRGETELVWTYYILPFSEVNPNNRFWAGTVTYCVALGVVYNTVHMAGDWVRFHLPRRSLTTLKRIDLVKNEMEYRVRSVPGSAFVTLNGNAILES